jgi:hypothetical protein
MKKIITFSIASLVLLGSSAFGLVANINYGAAPASGGALFIGSDDDLAADSIAIGYFTGAANAELTGWVQLGVDTSFEQPSGFNIASVTNVDTTAADGLDAWILVSDAGFSGLVRLNTWTALTGADAPTPTPTLAYQLGTADTAAAMSFLGDVVIADGGGFGGTGVSVTVVPEPSTFAALAGFLALGCVALRRRK